MRTTALLLLTGLLTLGLSTRPQDPAPIEVPIGAVLPWWGMERDIPPGFEICDGRTAHTPGSLLPERKPDLRDRFLKGADKPASFRPRSAREGGNNEVSLELTDSGHKLEGSEVPSIKLGTSDDGFADDTGFDHTHTVFVDRVEVSSVIPDPDETVWVHLSGDQSDQKNPDPDELESEVQSADPDLEVDPDEWKPANNAEAPREHTHTFEVDFDNQPEHVEMLFIVRVK